jgi:hypothetical protein
MQARIAISLAALLTLAACGGTSEVWVKEGVSRAQVRADQANCRAQADAALGRTADVTSDIRGSLRGGREDTRDLVASTRDYGTAKRYDRTIAQCMRLLGYTHPSN